MSGLVAKSSVNQSNLLHMIFDRSNSYIIAAGEQELITFTINGRLKLM